MTRLKEDRLIALTTVALERTAFVLAEPVPAAAVTGLAMPRFCATIRYDGPDQGEVILRASDGFLIELASSLLGVEPDEVQPENQGCDALKELANIVGGSVIYELGGRNCQYSLGLPQLITPVPQVEADCSCWLESAGELMDAHWRCMQTAARAA